MRVFDISRSLRRMFLEYPEIEEITLRKEEWDALRDMFLSAQRVGVNGPTIEPESVKEPLIFEGRPIWRSMRRAK